MAKPGTEKVRRNLSETTMRIREEYVTEAREPMGFRRPDDEIDDDDSPSATGAAARMGKPAFDL